MSERSILILGGGSIGKRHVRNLIASGLSAEQLTVVDPREDRRREVVGLGIPDANVLAARDVALQRRTFDGAIIATPTSMHYDDALAVAQADVHLMIEKPLGVDLNGYERLKAEVDRRGLFAFVAYCYRFNEGARKMRDLIRRGKEGIGEPYYARGEMCSYLPEWHPTEDYRHFYMAKKALGGGTLLDQSHLFDLTRMFLGEIRGLYGISTRQSDLDIETDDFGEVVLDMASGVRVSLHIDLFSQPPRRHYHVMGSKGTLQWDITTNTVTRLVQKDRQQAVIEEFIECDRDTNEMYDKNAMYMGELAYFLRGIEADGPIDGPTLLDGRAAMDVVQAVRESRGTRYVPLPDVHDDAHSASARARG
jgi:predicted dehydrogenase